MSQTKNQEPKLKNLTMNRVTRESNKINKMETYQLDNEYQIKFYPIFSYGKIEELLEEYQRDLIYAEEKGIDLEVSDRFVYRYIVFLCVKHFTDLGKSISDKVEDKILQMNHLVNTGYLNQIADEVFMVTEVHKVFDTMSNITANFELLQRVNQKAAERVGQLEFQYQQMLDQLNLDVKETTSEPEVKQTESNSLN